MGGPIMPLHRLHLALALAATLAACGRKEEPVEANAAATVEAAPSPPGAAADWSSLGALVGKLPVDSGLFDTSAAAGEFHSLLGLKLGTLKTNLQTSSPLREEGGVIFSSGNKAHEGGMNQAYVIVDPARQAVEVGLWENGRLAVYRTAGADLPKPQDIQVMIRNAAEAPA
jgi:hypothetical protein